MPTLKQTAMAYVPKQPKTVADLPYFSVNLEVKKDQAKDKNNKVFDINFVEIDGEHYRIPDSVLKSMKNLLTAIPNIENFKVIKSGEGMNTEYQTIPYQK